MLRLILFITFTLVSLLSHSQASDFIVVKKENGRTIQTFMAGKAIIFKTNTGALIDGQIKVIRDDSIFVVVCDIRTVPTHLGVTMVDTVSKSIFGTHYHNISRIKVFNHSDRVRGKLGSLLIIGGTGYILLNVANSIGHNEPLTEKRNLRNLSIAAGAIALGYLSTQYFLADNFSRKWYKFVYVKMK